MDLSVRSFCSRSCSNSTVGLSLFALRHFHRRVSAPLPAAPIAALFAIPGTDYTRRLVIDRRAAEIQVSFLAELKRRNVFRVAAAYAVVGWLLAQISDVALDAFEAPAWVGKTILLLLALGFPLAIVFAWAFELTPEGVKREKDVDRSASITRTTGRKLDRVVIGALAVAVGFLLVDKLVLPEKPEPVTTESSGSGVEKSVAVLPFIAMSDGPDDAYFADGLTEEILNSLAQVPELLVTARTSAFAFKGQDMPLPEIARKLGVAHVVEGSVRRAGDRLRVTAQLIRAADGFHLWSQTYERTTADSFGVQDEIAGKVAIALDVVLDEAQVERMRSVGLRNPEAFVLYQQATELLGRAHEQGISDWPVTFRNANVLLEQVLALEPGFSGAHFDHADYFIHIAIDGDESGPLTETEVNEALARANFDFQNAIKNARTEAEQLNATLELALISRQFSRLPGLIDAAAQSAGCIDTGWWTVVMPLLPSLDASLALAERKRQCDPLQHIGWRDGAELLAVQGDFQGSIETARQGLQKVQHRLIAFWLVLAHIGAGEYDEALAVSERFFDSDAERDAYRLDVAMAQGDADFVDSMHDAVVARGGSSVELRRPTYLAFFARSGQRDKANELAASIDSEPLGFLTLLEAAGNCVCGAPWDIEATPDLKNLVDEAGLVWPPPAPIDWPLKNW